MARIKPSITGTRHLLPFEQLSPLDFERLCLWLVEREGYERAEHLGAAGSEMGRDITAWRDDKRWIFQCKRVQRFGGSEAVKEIEKVLSLPKDLQPAHYVFIVTSNVSSEARQKVREAYTANFEIEFWAYTEFDEKVKRHSEIITEFFNLSTPLSEENNFGIYLLCSEYDEDLVEELAFQLEDSGEEIKVWFDKWFVVPGEFHPQQDDVIFKSGKSYAIFLGEHTPIEWFKSNLKEAIETQKSDSSIVILPVLLPLAKELNIDDYPEIRTWIDFRSGIDEYKAFRLLISGINRVPPGKPPRIKTSVYEDDPIYKNLYLLKKLHDEQIIDKTMKEQYTRNILDNLVGSKE